MTEIWYSSLLSERTYYYLCASLRGLFALKSAADLKTATGGLTSLNESHLKVLREVWKRWLDMRVEGTSSIRKQRLEAINEDPRNFDGKISYYKCIPKEHVPTAQRYMEDGVFRRTQGCSFAENPTLTGPSVFSEDGPFTYCCPIDALPFAGWDYVEVKKFKHTKSLVSMYGKYIDSKLASFMEKLTSKQVSFDIILGDCVNIEEYLNKETTYDRILTSNLMDYIFLPKLLRYSIFKI